MRAPSRGMLHAPSALPQILRLFRARFMSQRGGRTSRVDGRGGRVGSCRRPSLPPGAQGSQHPRPIDYRGLRRAGTPPIRGQGCKPTCHTCSTPDRRLFSPGVRIPGTREETRHGRPHPARPSRSALPQGRGEAAEEGRGVQFPRSGPVRDRQGAPLPIVAGAVRLHPDPPARCHRSGGRSRPGGVQQRRPHGKHLASRRA